MKVLIVNNLYAPNVRGGAERSVQLLAEALVRRGIEVTVVCTDEQARHPSELNGVKVLRLALPNLHWPFGTAAAAPMRRKLWHVVDLYNPTTPGRLAPLLRAERPDVVHTNNLQGISVAAWSAAAAAGVPVLHTLRDYYLTCARALRFRDGRNCTRTCFECLPFATARRRSSRHVAGVAGVSRFILDRHLALGFFSRASLRAVIHNPSIPDEPTTRAGQPLVFGYLGRLETAKGAELLIRAFAGRTDARWQLLVGGVGPAVGEEALRRQAAMAKRPEQIRLLGWTDAAALLRRIDVLVVPSLWHEPLPRAAIEAQSHGVAVLASRRGGLTEIVEDGTSGLLFEPDDPASLPAAIDRLLDEPQLARRLGGKAFAQSGTYRPDDVAARYADAYAGLRVSASSR